MHDDDYILGTDAAELERLRFQHQVWVKELYLLAERAGLRAGQRGLDLGCGPGFTTFELAHLVGTRGHVLARDQSERFLTTLRAEAARLEMPQIEASLGPVETLAFPAASLDFAYARWLFCWLPEPLPVLRDLTRALRPGGVLVLQEYVDWGAMQLLPNGPAFTRGVEACLASWRAGGATINFAAELPALAPRAGLVIEHFAPRARLGAVGSLEWRWLDEFFRSYLPKVVERGLLSPRELEEWLLEWDARTGDVRCLSHIGREVGGPRSGRVNERLLRPTRTRQRTTDGQEGLYHERGQDHPDRRGRCARSLGRDRARLRRRHAECAAAEGSGRALPGSTLRAEGGASEHSSGKLRAQARDEGG
jgi:SAM-dependent methyltransferase